MRKIAIAVLLAFAFTSACGGSGISDADRAESERIWAEWSSEQRGAACKGLAEPGGRAQVVQLIAGQQVGSGSATFGAERAGAIADYIAGKCE